METAHRALAAQVAAEGVLRLGEAPAGGLEEVLALGGGVQRAAETEGVAPGELVDRERVTLMRRRLDPPEPRPLVLRDAFAFEQLLPEAQAGLRVRLERGPVEPADGLRRVLGDARPMLVVHADAPLRARVPVLRGEAVPGEGLRPACIAVDGGVAQLAEFVAGGRFQPQGGLEQPEPRLEEVGLDAVSMEEALAGEGLALRVARLGSAPEPVVGGVPVQGESSDAAVVGHADDDHRPGVSADCRSVDPVDAGHGVGGHAFSLVEAEAVVVLGCGVALLRALPVPVAAQLHVGRHALPAGVAVAERVVADGAARVGGLVREAEEGVEFPGGVEADEFRPIGRVGPRGGGGIGCRVRDGGRVGIGTGGRILRVVCRNLLSGR